MSSWKDCPQALYSEDSTAYQCYTDAYLNPSTHWGVLWLQLLIA